MLETVWNVYGLDFFDVCGVRSRYNDLPDDEGRHKYLGGTIPIEPRLLHSCLTNPTYFINKSDAQSPTKDKANRQETGGRESPNVRLTKFKKKTDRNILSDTGCGKQLLGDGRQAINFLPELKVTDEKNLGRPYTKRVTSSFIVTNMFVRLSVFSEPKDEEADNVGKCEFELLTSTQPELNHRKMHKGRVDGEKGKAGVLDSAYGTSDVPFSTQEATILPYALAFQNEIKMSHVDDGHRERSASNVVKNAPFGKNFEEKNNLIYLGCVTEPPHKKKQNINAEIEGLVTKPYMSTMKKKHYKELLSLWEATIISDINDFYEISDEGFNKLSWNDKCVILISVLIKAIQIEFHGFESASELLRFLGRLRKYHGIEFKIPINQGNSEPEQISIAHLYHSCKLLVQKTTSVGLAFLEGCCRSACCDWAMLHRKSDIANYVHENKDDQKCYSENPPAISILRIDSTMNFFSMELHHRNDMAQYTKAKAAPLCNFSHQEQKKNSRTHKTTLCDSLAVMVRNVRDSFLKVPEKAIYFRNPDAMLTINVDWDVWKKQGKIDIIAPLEIEPCVYGAYEKDGTDITLNCRKPFLKCFKSNASIHNNFQYNRLKATHCEQDLNKNTYKLDTPEKKTKKI